MKTMRDSFCASLCAHACAALTLGSVLATPAAAQKPAAGAPAPAKSKDTGVSGANLSISSMSANGLTVQDLSCKLASLGLLGALEIVGSLSSQKAALAKCEPAGGRPRVLWTLAKGHAKVSRVENASSAAAEACITAAVGRVTSSLEGTCSVVLVLEKP